MLSQKRTHHDDQDSSNHFAHRGGHDGFAAGRQFAGASHGLPKQTIALATRQRPTHRCADLTPSSPLTRVEAKALANALSLVKGKGIVISNVAGRIFR